MIDIAKIRADLNPDILLPWSHQTITECCDAIESQSARIVELKAEVVRLRGGSEALALRMGAIIDATKYVENSYASDACGIAIAALAAWEGTHAA